MKLIFFLLLAMPVGAASIGVSPDVLHLDSSYAGVLTLSNPAPYAVAYEIKDVVKGIIPPETILNQLITLKINRPTPVLIEFSNAPALMVSVLPPKANPAKGIAILAGVLITGCSLGIATLYFYNKYSRTF